MTLAEMKLKLAGKSLCLHNGFNGKTSRYRIKEVDHAEGGFCMRGEDSEGIEVSLSAPLPTILNMLGQGITNELPCITGGTFKSTISIA